MGVGEEANFANVNAVEDIEGKKSFLVVRGHWCGRWEIGEIDTNKRK